MRIRVITCVVLACLAQLVNAAQYRERQTLTVENPMPSEGLGYSLDASNGLMIAGAINSRNEYGEDVGAAYVYRQSSTEQWELTAKLKANDGMHNDTFGWSVGIDGTVAVVAAHHYGGYLRPSGGAYVFEHDTRWNQVAKLEVPADATSFANLVNIHDSRIAIAGSANHTIITQTKLGQFNIPWSYAKSVSHGFVNVYDQTGPGHWLQSQRVEFSGETSRVDDLALGDKTLVIGGSSWNARFIPELVPIELSPVRDPSLEEKVELFEQLNGQFTLTTTLSHHPNAEQTWFGWSVALDQDRLIVGAPKEDTHGSAYIYERNQAGQWEEAAHLKASDFDQRYYFGSDVALAGNLALVNSWDGPGCLCDGIVYAFERDEAGQWSEIAKLTSAHATGTFGQALAIYGDQFLVGSGVNTHGAVHAFAQVPEPAISFLFIAIAVFPAICTRTNRR